MSERLLYLGPPDTVSLVTHALPGFDVRHATTAEQTDALLPECVGVLDAYMKVPLPADRLARAPHLRAVVTATTGATHIDGAALEHRGIPLLTLRGQTEFLRNITPAAELSWMLLMMCARRARPAIAEVLAGGWDRNNHPGMMLNGRTIGIIGCGRLGCWMARYAATFGMHRLGFDPVADPWPAGIEQVSMEDLLRKSDFITLHVNFDERLRGMIGAKEIAHMKHGAIFINTSRGELVDEAALAEALRSGRLGGAGLDVLQGEPETAHHPLVEMARTHGNIVITPHIGGYSPDALGRVLEFSCARLVKALQRSIK